MQRSVFSFAGEAKETEARSPLIGGSAFRVLGVLWLHLCWLANRQPQGFTPARAPGGAPATCPSPLPRSRTEAGGCPPALAAASRGKTCDLEPCLPVLLFTGSCFGKELMTVVSVNHAAWSERVSQAPLSGLTYS